MKIRKLLVGFLALIMVLTLCMAAFAEGVDPETPAQAWISKNLRMADGITYTGDHTFTMKFAALNGAPAINDITFTYSNSAKGQKSTEVVMPAIGSFPDAGVYEYTVSENNGNTTVDIGDGKMHYSAAQYKMSVYLANKADGSGLYIKQIDVVPTVDEAGQAVQNGEKVDITDPGENGNNGFVFANTYMEAGGNAGGDDPDDPTDDPSDPAKTVALKIGKTVTGTTNPDALQKDFTFKVTFTYPEAYIAGTYTANPAVTSGQEQQFTLKSGEFQFFKGLPAGTTYTITEVGTPNYKASMSVIANGGTPVVSNATKFGADLTVSNQLIGENANSDAVTNAYNDIPITGVILNVLPYALMLAVAASVLVLFVVIKRKKQNAEKNG